MLIYQLFMKVENLKPNTVLVNYEIASYRMGTVL